MLARKALAGTAGAPKLYVEDVMSCFLYTGNSSTQTITNNIDISTEGGLLWIKARDGARGHTLFDTTRTAGDALFTNSTSANTTGYTQSFLTTGFSVGNNTDTNSSSYKYVSWTFRQAKKFFDVVAYTGNGSAPRNISHNLDSSPGFIAIKRTDSTGDWWCWHRSIANKNIYLNYTDAADSGANPMISAVSSTNFTLATNQNATMNINGATYVAYLFAHDAGGFGDAGSDNIITCGSYTTDGSGKATINLGYEPQWLLVKGSSFASNWFIVDTMRGLDATSLIKPLYANSNVAEDTDNTIGITSTGFTATTGSSLTFIYIAIRRGPMKTPTSGTSVFSPVTRAGSGAAASVTSVGFPPDLTTLKVRNGGSQYNFIDRLRGREVLYSGSTAAAIALNANVDTAMESNVGFSFIGAPENVDCNYSGLNDVYHNFRRAPGFFDVVCYTGTGSATTFSHNLGVAPELYIVKRRDSGTNWFVYSSTTGNSAYLQLNLTSASATSSNIWNNTSPTSSVFSVSNSSNVNGSGATYVAYLFASVSGVSKVGSYTGNGSNQTINCGFTNGARFILIKRTDSTGDWYVYDSARGIVSGNDPQLKLNSTAAEATGYDAVDPDNSGFIVNNDATNFPINVNSASYIFLAIA